MINQYAVISKRVEEFVCNLIELLNKCDESDLLSQTNFALSAIANEFGTDGYEFNLALEILVEKTFLRIKPSLIKILSIVDDSSFNIFCCDTSYQDVIFSSYYAISLIYKKENNIDKLNGLLDEKYDFLQAYPLSFEVSSRYYKRVKQWEAALECDKSAINILRRKNINNPAVCISFASTICLMCENDYDEIDNDDFIAARNYVEAAIDFNPNYPKYYFLKAKIIYYSTQKKAANISDDIQKEIFELLEDAEAVLFDLYGGRSSYTKAERKAYAEFKNKVKNNSKKVFNQINMENVALIKQEIINSSQQKESYHPPLPNLKPTDKFVFVCYSSSDYKSVYCDLIELYLNRVCYKYDSFLKYGANWEEQVKKIILSENCVGVIFYISKNTIFSDGFCKEIRFISKMGVPYFCVNLEGNIPPSKVAMGSIVEMACKFGKDFPATMGKNLKTFLNAFDDDDVYVSKFSGYNDDGNEHISNLINAIKDTFTY